MLTTSTLLEHVQPVIELVPDVKLKQALTSAFEGEGEAIAAVERLFALVPEKKWSNEAISCLFNSWKATHLKMLGIYGLSCRLQILADSSEPDEQVLLLTAAAKNAETSHEDLGIDAGGLTHAELYDTFAGTYAEEGWQLKKHCLDSAREFSKWVYDNMVVEDIQVGLFTNMLSEIYNHGEYSTALPYFDQYSDSFYELAPIEKASALTYIQAHIEDETEIGHFLVVLDSLNLYLRGTGNTLNYELAENVFRNCLKGIGRVMTDLEQHLRSEL